MSTIDKEKYFEDSLLPKFSKEGIPMRDPRDINDPDYDKPVGNIETENFTFDISGGIAQTKEEETEHFEEYVSKFGEARFAEVELNIQNRNFSVSSNPEEWKFVERLIPPALIPAITPKESFPSGFELPKISPEEAIEKYEYFVGRPVSQMLPVYLIISSNDHFESVSTKIGKCEGNLYKLREDIDNFLEKRYKREFIAQVSELQQCLLYRGEFEEEFKEFLLSKGF